jgi:hypothetical protein
MDVYILFHCENMLRLSPEFSPVLLRTVSSHPVHHKENKPASTDLQIQSRGEQRGGMEI